MVTTTEPAKRVVVRVVAEHDDSPIGKLRGVESQHIRRAVVPVDGAGSRIRDERAAVVIEWKVDRCRCRRNRGCGHAFFSATVRWVTSRFTECGNMITDIYECKQN